MYLIVMSLSQCSHNIWLVFYTMQAEAEVRRLKDAITQAQEEEREHAERAIQTLVHVFKL